MLGSAPHGLRSMFRMRSYVKKSSHIRVRKRNKKQCATRKFLRKARRLSSALCMCRSGLRVIAKQLKSPSTRKTNQQHKRTVAVSVGLRERVLLMVGVYLCSFISACGVFILELWCNCSCSRVVVFAAVYSFS